MLLSGGSLLVSRSLSVRAVGAVFLIVVGGNGWSLNVTVFLVGFRMKGRDH